ncbi:hypothetical protein LZG00_11220 [Rhodobacteraceae bacterium LMO-12]|nr:hypothetical protein [Rhodobacteraceae bacterium LMO-JJ12]
MLQFYYIESQNTAAFVVKIRCKKHKLPVQHCSTAERNNSHKAPDWQHFFTGQSIIAGSGICATSALTEWLADSGFIKREILGKIKFQALGKGTRARNLSEKKRLNNARAGWIGYTADGVAPEKRHHLQLRLS